MAIIEIQTASDARKLLLALVTLASPGASKLPLPFPPIRATPVPTGVRFDVTQGEHACTVQVDNAGADRDGVLLFSADQIKALASTLAATDKRLGFDLWGALRAAHAPAPDWYFPPFEKVVDLRRAEATVEWACFDLGLLARLKPILDLTTSIPPARSRVAALELRPVKDGVIIEAGPVRGVMMGCKR